MDKMLENLQNPWVIVGAVGQLVFMLRFLIQWFVSEKAKASIIPVAFWYISIAGSVILLVYAVAVGEPIIFMGQSLGFVIYFRNLVFIRRRKEAQA